MFILYVYSDMITFLTDHFLVGKMNLLQWYENWTHGQDPSDLSNRILLSSVSILIEV